MAKFRGGPHHIACGRLSPSTGVPVETGDVTAADNLYYVPYIGDQVGIRNGVGDWDIITFPELSLAGSGLTASRLHDIFIEVSGGAPALAAVAWTNDTTRATALARQDGVYCLGGTLTRRYLGVAYVDANNQFNFAANLRHIRNYYHRVVVPIVQTTDDDDWSGGSDATWRQAAGSSANQVEIVCGELEDRLHLEGSLAAFNSSTGVGRAIGIGEDSTSSPMSEAQQGYADFTQSNELDTMRAHLEHVPPIGRRVYALLEYTEVAASTTWYGDGGAALLRHGLFGSFAM